MMLYRRLHPDNWRIRLVLRGVALAQLLYGVIVLPLWLVLYGVLDIGTWWHQTIRPAALTLWHGRGGPLNSRGEVWCVW